MKENIPDISESNVPSLGPPSPPCPVQNDLPTVAWDTAWICLSNKMHFPFSTAYA